MSYNENRSALQSIFSAYDQKGDGDGSGDGTSQYSYLVEGLLKRSLATRKKSLSSLTVIFNPEDNGQRTKKDADTKADTKIDREADRNVDTEEFDVKGSRRLSEDEIVHECECLMSNMSYVLRRSTEDTDLFNEFVLLGLIDLVEIMMKNAPKKGMAVLGEIFASTLALTNHRSRHQALSKRANRFLHTILKDDPDKTFKIYNRIRSVK